MRRTARIILEYLLAFGVIFFLLLAIAGVVMVKFYGEDLQHFVMDQVSERLESTVEVEEVSVKVFHKFPNTSILLEGVTLWSSHNFNPGAFQGSGSDTLLSARTVSVSFNLLSLLRKQYNLRQLEILNGYVNLYTDRNGEGNYMIVRRRDSGKKKEQQINLNQVRVADFQFRLDNQAKQLISSGRISQLELNGKFSRRTSQIKGSLEGALEEISNKGIPYASRREVRSRLSLTVNDSLYTIKNGQLQLDRILADVEGTVHPLSGKGVDLDLNASARDMEIHEVLDLLPGNPDSGIHQIEGNGILQLSARISGKASSLATPAIDAHFQTSDATLRWKERFPFTLRDLNLTGNYSNGGAFSPVSTTLHVDSISCSIGDDRISGKGFIQNFIDPEFALEMKGEIHPEQWADWYDELRLKKAGGTIVTDMKASGTHNRSGGDGSRFLALDLTGGITLQEVGFDFRNEIPPVTGLNGTVYIENDFWEPSLSGTYGQSSFSIAGSGANLLSFLMKTGDPLVAAATFRSGFLNLQEVLDHLPGKNRDGHEAVLFPGRLNLKLDFTVDELLKGPFHASNVRGVATYDPPLFLIDSLTMQSMEGTLRGELGMFQEAGGEVFTNVNATLYQIDIRQLFHSFNNFGQEQLTEEHLEGILSGTSVFSASFDSTFRIRTPSILSENNITIRNGQLNSYSPMMALSRFIEVKELENIHFETLENTVLIRDNQVIIPSMDILSNALNLSASGNHGFDNLFDYRLRLKLSDLLYSKARGNSNNEFVMAEDESDARTLFLKVYNDGHGTTVEMDRERTAERIREGMKDEKEELKRVLNRELGLFRKDTSLTDGERREADQKEMFKFEFDE